MCKSYKHFSYFRFRAAKCKLCIYFHRNRFGYTKNQLREDVYKYKLKIKNK